MTEPIELEVVDVIDPRAVAVRQQPGQALVSEAVPAGPAAMVAMASDLAAVLKDVVERQKLYTVIQGKKFPQVEAWMTIARMDNVVAREVTDGIIRHEDGSYEASVELIRLSDGMVIGRGSALCGTDGDKPWNTRAEPARRSMAVTRATSRAFRQQYSWIMALAGYEPTPAEEMPRDEERVRSDVRSTDDGALIGTAEVGDKSTSDFLVRQTPEGSALGFRLRGEKGGILVETRGPLADQLYDNRFAAIGKLVTVWGAVTDRSFTPDKPGARKVTYQVLTAERMRVPEIGDLPVAGAAPAPAGELTEAESEAIWSEIERIGA